MHNNNKSMSSDNKSMNSECFSQLMTEIHKQIHQQQIQQQREISQVINMNPQINILYPNQFQFQPYFYFSPFYLNYPNYSYNNVFQNHIPQIIIEVRDYLVNNKNKMNENNKNKKNECNRININKDDKVKIKEYQDFNNNVVHSQNIIKNISFKTWSTKKE